MSDWEVRKNLRGRIGVVQLLFCSSNLLRSGARSDEKTYLGEGVGGCVSRTHCGSFCLVWLQLPNVVAEVFRIRDWQEESL